jgi:hypothetical protein
MPTSMWCYDYQCKVPWIISIQSVIMFSDIDASMKNMQAWCCGRNARKWRNICASPRHYFKGVFKNLKWFFPIDSMRIVCNMRFREHNIAFCDDSKGIFEIAWIFSYFFQGSKWLHPRAKYKRYCCFKGDSFFDSLLVWVFNEVIIFLNLFRKLLTAIIL